MHGNKRWNSLKLEEPTLFGLDGNHVDNHSVAYSHFTYKQYLLTLFYSLYMYNSNMNSVRQ